MHVLCFTIAYLPFILVLNNDMEIQSIKMKYFYCNFKQRTKTTFWDESLELICANPNYFNNST
jgi:hypothetical protein